MSNSAATHQILGKPIRPGYILHPCALRWHTLTNGRSAVFGLDMPFECKDCTQRALVYRCALYMGFLQKRCVFFTIQDRVVFCSNERDSQYDGGEIDFQRGECGPILP